MSRCPGGQTRVPTDTGPWDQACSEDPEGEPDRPDLGPGPALSIDASAAPLAAPCTAVLQAVATAGTGEFENGSPRVAWEIYGPDRGVVLQTGESIEVDLPAGGLYRVRAAAADVFGRPAAAWTDLKVAETRSDAALLPAEWLFRTDPGDTGIAERWQATDYEDSGWTEIPVPAWWETTPVGAYDGYAWYRVRFTLAPDLEGQKLWLEFAGVDESAWVYLNEELIGERSAQSTGLAPADLWDEPFSVPVEGVRYGQENVLAVRVHDSAQMGGIFRPVRLLVDK